MRIVVGGIEAKDDPRIGQQLLTKNRRATQRFSGQLTTKQPEGCVCSPRVCAAITHQLVSNFPRRMPMAARPATDFPSGGNCFFGPPLCVAFGIFSDSSPMRALAWTMVVALLLVLSVALLPSGMARAETRCVSRPATGGGILTSCHEVGGGAPVQQYWTRAAVGGGSITVGSGRTCTSRPAVGGGTLTTCR
jgi:hypothetical protein